jgi:hypothetical protein
VIPYRLIAYGAAAIALIAILWWVQARIRVSYQAEQERDAAVANLSAYQRAVETNARLAALKQAEDQAADAAMSRRVDALRNDNDKLRATLALLRTTVERTDANGNRSAAVSGLYWLCVGTAVSRDPTDTAACQAGTGPAGVPDPISH